ncbi:laccase-7-like [Wolffia australiana]
MAASAYIFLFLACTVSLCCAPSRAAIVKHTFHVREMKIQRLCQERTIVAVNGIFPGPTVHAREGDRVAIRVINESPYNMSVHWHGIFQLLSGWADGPSYVTQCPITPGQSYTYRFKIIGQEGTLWWHAHVSFLRATVHGALVIHPNDGANAYPFPKPYREVPIILGEWWNANVVDVEAQALATGGAAKLSDAFTVNGSPGDLYPCSSEGTFKLEVSPGKRYLLRIINAALDTQFFFKIAGHPLTVVAIDAAYTAPYRTKEVVLAPGQTVDAILVADAPAGSYYMAARPYDSVQIVPFDNTTTTAILRYASSNDAAAVMPKMPAFNDAATAYRFYSSLTGLVYDGAPPLPLRVDERMFVVFGLNLVPCDKGNGTTCAGPFGEKFAASMNNASFQLPKRLSLLEAHFFGMPGIFTPDFGDRPPVIFDYTSEKIRMKAEMMQTSKSIKVKRIRYNSTVEVALQNTAFLAKESHPIHLHGFNFFVLAQGFGNYDRARAEKRFNLVNPQVRNTIAVPVGGWAVIRFVANNPGVWIMHCHLDVHLPLGMAMAFVVEDGPTAASKLPPPPIDLPRC